MVRRRGGREAYLIVFLGYLILEGKLEPFFLLTDKNWTVDPINIQLTNIIYKKWLWIYPFNTPTNLIIELNHLQPNSSTISQSIDPIFIIQLNSIHNNIINSSSSTRSTKIIQLDSSNSVNSSQLDPSK